MTSRAGTILAATAMAVAISAGAWPAVPSPVEAALGDPILDVELDVDSVTAGDTVTLSAEIFDADGSPMTGPGTNTRVRFYVQPGSANDPGGTGNSDDYSCNTGQAGTCTVTYVAVNAGTDVICARTSNGSGECTEAVDAPERLDEQDTVQRTVAAGAGPSPSPISSPTPSPDPSPSVDPSPSTDPGPSPSVDPSPSTDPGPSPSVEPSTSPSIEPSPSASGDPSPTPSADPTPSPASTPTPGDDPTPPPADHPTPPPADHPTPPPADHPTPPPAGHPTEAPDGDGDDPSGAPSPAPDASPQASPEPTPVAVVDPSSAPTEPPLTAATGPGATRGGGAGKGGQTGGGAGKGGQTGGGPAVPDGVIEPGAARPPDGIAGMVEAIVSFAGESAGRVLRADAAAGVATTFGFPLALAVLVLLFLLVQPRLDDRDPKLRSAPLTMADSLVAFEDDPR